MTRLQLHCFKTLVFRCQLSLLSVLPPKNRQTVLPLKYLEVLMLGSLSCCQEIVSQTKIYYFSNLVRYITLVITITLTKILFPLDIFCRSINNFLAFLSFFFLGGGEECPFSQIENIADINQPKKMTQSIYGSYAYIHTYLYVCISLLEKVHLSMAFHYYSCNNLLYTIPSFKSPENLEMFFVNFQETQWTVKLALN